MHTGFESHIRETYILYHGRMTTFSNYLFQIYLIIGLEDISIFCSVLIYLDYFFKWVHDLLKTSILEIKCFLSEWLFRLISG